MEKWEYLFVIATNEGNQWRPQYVNGQELSGWQRGPTLYQFANQMGEQGWELVAAPYTETAICGSDSWGNTHNTSYDTTYRLIFKRVKS